MHAGTIRDHLTYRGTVDPLHGDAVNKAVRDAAKEAITAVYETVPNQGNTHARK